MMITKKHSILIAYGRRREALFKCLESIRAQHIDSEIVVVDMYNDDLDLSGYQAKYIALTRPPGDIFIKARCLNHAVQHAAGEYVSVIDCDMIISPGWFKAISEKFHPTTVIVTPVFMQPQQITRSLMAKRISIRQLISTPGYYIQTGRSQITLLRKHLLRRLLREEYIGYGAEDSELNDRLAASFRFQDLDKRTPFYHMYHPRNHPTPYYNRLSHNRAIYRQHRASLKPRLGIYVASNHASKILPTHLAKIGENTETEFDYYIADNSIIPDEKTRFDEIIQHHEFVTKLHSPSPHHGDTLQYMVEHTANEIIVLFDVDAFPLRPWDRWALEKLKKKKVLGVLSHVASREIDYHLHPSFMVFRRSFLEENQLDLRAGHLSRRRTDRLPLLDPAGKLTCYLKDRNQFSPDHIEALLPTQVEIPFQEPFQWNGHQHLRRGFGVTYNDMIFHFWFGRNLHRSSPIYDDKKRLVVSSKQVDRIVEKYTGGTIKTVQINSDFSVGPDLVEAIRQMTPKNGFGLDLGAGNLFSASALADKCRQVFSLEENKQRVDSLLPGAAANLKVLYSPLENGNYPYQYFEQLDAIVVDGPRGHHRQGCLPWLANLRKGGLLFLDDAQRPRIKKLCSIMQEMGFQIIKEGKNGSKRIWCVLQKMEKSDTLIDLLMLSYNRSEYTRMTLESFCEVDSGIDRGRINFTVIDQASTDESVREIAAFLCVHPGIIDNFIVTDKNRGASGGFGYFFNHCNGTAPFIGKIDNDSIFTPGWLRKLINSLAAHPNLGVVGAQEDINQGKNDRPVTNETRIGYFPARFVGGRFLARREVFAKHIPDGSGVFGWTKFQQQYIRDMDIGWCIPASVIEHVGEWNFRHPMAIKNSKYIQYFESTGRIRKG